VAVVGGGPAGLAAAIRLLEAGHRVTLVDKSQRLGGVPDGIIPEERYGDAQAEVDAILKPARDAGRLELQLGACLGRDVSLADLRRTHDAVFLGAGLDAGEPLGAAAGVEDALAFLGTVKRGTRTTVPDRVAVLGAGNTAMDAAATALRLGARDVYLVYRRSFREMPAWAKERDALIAAGAHVLVLVQPLGYVTDPDGRLTGLRLIRTELGAPDAAGRRQPVPVPGTEFVLDVGLVVEAVGQGLSADLRQALADLEFTPRGRLAVHPDTGATSLPGVYAGGDIVNGGTTAVQAIADGMRAAAAIDQFLSGNARG